MQPPRWKSNEVPDGQMQPPSLNGLPSGGIEPLAPLSSGLETIITLCEHVALGLLACAIAGLALRRLWVHRATRPRVRTRAGAGAGVVASAQPALAAWLSPLRLARALARRRRIAHGAWLREDRLIVGYDAALKPVEIELRSGAGGRHHLLLGAAGSGKTVTMTWIAVRAIEAGMAAVVVDPKDDGDLRAALRAAAVRAGRPLIEWSPDGDAVYNPLARGHEGEVADKALAGERFTEPHYLRQAQRYVGHAVRALRAAGEEVSFATLAEQMDPERLALLLSELRRDERSAGEAYLESLGGRQRGELAGVRDRLALLAESDAGRWLDPRRRGTSFELHGALCSGAVVLFRLRSDERPLLMEMLGGAVVLDLLTSTAALQSRRLSSIAVIDEFAALASPRVAGLFARARAAGLSLVLGTQELTDLEVAGSVALRRQVTGNLASVIAHRQMNPEAAEWVARYGGVASPVAGRARGRALLDSEQLRTLEVGCAAVIADVRHRRRTRLEPRLARMLSIAHLR
ncbi:MAG: type IV secretory system conjugative DNA transfer family protein [Solirubrobacteraceae bacterium]